MLLHMISLVMVFVATRLRWWRAIVGRACWWLFDFERQVLGRSGRRLWRRFRLECEAKFVHVSVVLRIVVSLIVVVQFGLFIRLRPPGWMELVLFILDISRVFVHGCRTCPDRIWPRSLLLIHTTSLRPRRPLQVVEM